MVRLIPVEVNGKIVWAEDAPDACAGGHPVNPGWTSCPDCGYGVRVWRCRERCGAPQLYDDEHVHGRPV
jgi:hypothetical protein